MEGVAAQRQATVKQLQALPPAVTMNPTAVLGLVTGLCADVGALVHGSTPLNLALVQANGRVYAEFKDAIDSTAPAFVPHEKAQGGEDACAGRAQQSTLQPLYLEDVREHIRAYVHKPCLHRRKS